MYKIMKGTVKKKGKYELDYFCFRKTLASVPGFSRNIKIFLYFKTITLQKNKNYSNVVLHKTQYLKYSHLTMM